MLIIFPDASKNTLEQARKISEVFKIKSNKKQSRWGQLALYPLATSNRYSANIFMFAYLTDF